MQAIGLVSSFPWPVAISSATLVAASGFAGAAALRAEPLWLAPALVSALGSLVTGLWAWRRRTQALARVGLGLTSAAQDCVLTDAKHRIVQVGPAVTALIGGLAPAQRERAGGVDAARLVGGDLRPLLEAFGASAVIPDGSHDPKSVELTLAGRSIVVSAAPLRCDGGQSLGLLVRFTDCSAALAQRLREQAQADTLAREHREADRIRQALDAAAMPVRTTMTTRAATDAGETAE